MDPNDSIINVPDFDMQPEMPDTPLPLPESNSREVPADAPEPPLFESEGESTPEECEAPEPATDTVNEPPVLTDLTAIEKKLDLLMEKFDARLANDAGKDALFDKMYAEMAKYKTDIYAKLLKPLILSVSSMLDEANAFIERARTEEPDPAKMKKYISNIALDLEEMLEVNGVEIYAEETQVFNPSTQRVVGQVPVDDAALDNHIADRRRKGYRWNGVILRPEMVTIYKFKNQ